MKASWMFQNLASRARFALRHPAYTLRSLLNEVLLADERFLAEATGVPVRKLRTFLNEPFRSQGFSTHLAACRAELQGLKIQSAAPFGKKILLQYALIRAVQPDAVVETGVANGVSSAYLLLALQTNGRGRLHSIEVGDAAFLPKGKTVGWVVPDWLRERWQLHIGDSTKVLPALLPRIAPIDVFIHDSLHTYEHMMEEFVCTYPFLRPYGFLLADDALWNESFREFSDQVKARYARILHGVGFLRKENSHTGV
ncbi:MAG: class I SAM-dependent methyltransferase [Firmicutes bacterium]|nr:class I SAM-dependent methyltransferase [Bacillota bacterium]